MNFHLCCYNSFVKIRSFTYNGHIARWLPGSHGQQGVARHHCKSLYKQGHTMMSLDGTGFLVAWFEAYTLKSSGNLLFFVQRPFQQHIDPPEVIVRGWAIQQPAL